MLSRILASCLAITAVSCATVAHGTRETISIDSSPSGAAVSMKCQEVSSSGTTPAAIVIPRNATDCVATVSKSGYKSKTVSFDRAPSHFYWLNFAGVPLGAFGYADGTPFSVNESSGLALVLSSIAGFGIDAFDGAMFKHEPGNVHVELEPAPQ